MFHQIMELITTFIAYVFCTCLQLLNIDLYKQSGDILQKLYLF